MARLPINRPMCDRYPGSNCYITVEKMMAILATLPGDAALTPDRVGNLSVLTMAQDVEDFAEQLGYIEIGDEDLVAWEQPDEARA